MSLHLKDGVFIADDTLFPVMDLGGRDASSIEPMDEFNHLVAESDEVESTLLPIGDGVTICIKR